MLAPSRVARPPLGSGRSRVAGMGHRSLDGIVQVFTFNGVSRDGGEQNGAFCSLFVSGRFKSYRYGKRGKSEPHWLIDNGLVDNGLAYWSYLRYEGSSLHPR